MKVARLLAIATAVLAAVACGSPGSSPVASSAAAIGGEGVRSAGFLAYAYDYQIAGCAYDPNEPSAKIQVRVLSDANPAGMVGIAGYECPWSSASEYAGHGFVIQYRRPLDSPDNVKVVLYDAEKAHTTNLRSNDAQHAINQFHRSTETFLYQTQDYTIGISRRFGAAVSEFYNNRVDPSLNLVFSDPGSMVQTAYFGDIGDDAYGAPTDCAGLASAATHTWNPTQAGSQCPDANGADIGSVIDTCTSSRRGALCRLTSEDVPQPSDTAPDWIEYRVHYRDFFYPTDATHAYPYQPYDDLYGFVKYTFRRGFVQIDYQSWMSDSQLFGSLPPYAASYAPPFQQMPIAFLVQMTQYTAEPSSGQSVVIARSPFEAIDLVTDPEISYPVVAGSSRWILAESVDNRPDVPVMTPGDFLTLAFYSAVVGQDGQCPPRTVQAQFFGAGPADDSVTVNQSSEVQNMSFFTLSMNNYEMSRALLVPYRPGEQLAGSSVGTAVNTPEASGGWMPSWECNQ
jgi:hypothetical protein